ncbi:MAG TPA: hypothetical protein VGH14_15135 [Solirubrobacterales bacterium]|jgi:hypothetical protein
MKRSGWHGPSPALVIACLALFVALGGTVLAATKINGKKIEVRSLPGNRLEVGSVPGNRIAARSLKGAQIKADTMGEVPNAAHADSADNARRAQTATAADHAADATTINGHAVGCAQGRREFAGACWDLQPSANAVNLIEAAGACAARGGELPDLIALFVFDRQPGVAIEVDGEWTNSEELAGRDSWAAAFVEDGVRMSVAGPTYMNHFRCVTPLLS